jgi:hypothetical protein
LLAEEVFEEVGHAQWVFVMPKMLRPYFLHHRDLLGGLAQAAWETVLQLMCAAAGNGPLAKNDDLNEEGVMPKALTKIDVARIGEPISEYVWPG